MPPRKLHEIIPRDSVHTGSPGLSPGPDLPTEIRVDIAQKRQDLNEKKFDTLYVSPCFAVDKRVLEFTVKTIIGVGVIAFCCLQLTRVGCEESAGYWGMLSSTITYFLKHKVKTNK